MGQSPIATYNQYPGGTQPAYNITAAKVIKPTPGCLYRVVVSAPGTTGGSLIVSDSNCYVAAQTITGITAAANGVVTLSTGGSANPFAVGNTISFASIVGMTQLNGLVGTVVAIGGVTTAWTVTISINTSTFTAYASAGTAASFSVGNQILNVGFASLTAGQSIPLEWPCQNGIAVSGVPSAGSPSYALAYL